jgi:hypothetical protein
MREELMARGGYPRVVKVHQDFPGEALRDIGGATAEAVARLRLAERVRPGQRVAITAGSRGIANLPTVIAQVVAAVRVRGAEACIIPAMGSHGAATPEGQEEILRDYGITAEAVGAPVISQPEVVRIGTTPRGIPVYVDRLLNEVDHILVVNRVKPHTDFFGKIESGLQKMMAIGFGKHHSASACHHYFVDYGYEPVLREVSAYIMEHCRVLGGIALLENGRDETVRIVGVPRETLVEEEEALLAEAYQLIGRLPFEELHVLIVDEIGKHISGSGMDPNVTGRDTCSTHTPPPKPRIRRIIVRDLHPLSHGNAVGIGYADFVRRQAVEKIDWAASATNAVVGAGPETVRVPLTYDTDRQCLDAAFMTVGPTPPARVRLVRIRNTLLLDQFWASEALLPEIRANPALTLLTEPEPLRFDAEGNLLD